MKWPISAAMFLAVGIVHADPQELYVWRHETGDSEMVASAHAVERFNRKQNRWHVVVETLPQGSYQQAVIAAAMTKKLPCVLDLDQPSVPNFAWAGHIQALEGRLQPAGVDKLIAGGRSTLKGKLYAVGQFDVALALFARKSVLGKYGIRLATLDRPYTADEFRDILRRLKKQGVRYPVDLNGQRNGEWVTYAFSPWLQSAGSDLIDRKTFKVVDGVLNNDKALAVLDYYRSLFDERLASRRPVDEQAFLSGRAVFNYNGSWADNEYRRKFKDDLVVLPPPAFGDKPRIGAGSWQWAVTSSCPHPDGARQFIEHLISTEEITKFSAETGLMPTSEAAADATPMYRVGGYGRDYFEFARQFGVLRPETPAYPIISSSFERAMKEVREGGDAAEALDRAAEAIQQDLKRNRDYGF